MTQYRLLIVLIAFLVVLQPTFAQKSNKIIAPLEDFFSQVELKVFYGLANRPMNTSEFDSSGVRYAYAQANGKEFTIELTGQVYKNFYASLYFSKFSTTTQPFAEILPIDENSFFYVLEDNIRILRKGITAHYQKQFSKKSYSRFHLSAGLVLTTFKNDLELEGSEDIFMVKLKNKPSLQPFFSLGISSAIIKPELQLHIRYTKHFGTYDRIEDTDFGLAFHYDTFTINSLKQNTIQVGISWIMNFKNPLKVKGP